MSKQKAPIYQTVKEYLHNLYMRLYTPFRITGGKGYYVMKDSRGKEILIERKDFEKQYPLKSKIGIQNKSWKGENPDGTKSWMD